MGVSCIVDSVGGKIGLVDEQNVPTDMGVTVNPAQEFQPAAHVRRFKTLNVLDMVQTLCCAYCFPDCHARKNKMGRNSSCTSAWTSWTENCTFY